FPLLSRFDSRSLDGFLGDPAGASAGSLSFCTRYSGAMTTAQAIRSAYAARLERALPELLARVERAAATAGRPASAVRVVAVTKGHPLAAVDAALAAGLVDLGENRVEELEQKRAARPDAAATWHMIGHVQGRKAR